MRNPWLKRIVALVTWRWKLQLALNLPFIILWIADKKIAAVHSFDMNLLKTLNAEWLASLIGLA